ncbi:MAG: ABC-F family ATP-binding cassette domain-containing protein [Eubacteriales bacterium]|nr:ABC-F family ATP-binding cassette domain-containing protein [Eubacteriales bacterium]
MIDISVHELTKAFSEGENVLDGLSFDVQAGERVGILGRNGCGKTTLLRILTGELTADTGDISFAPDKRLGLISQIPRFPDGWTAEDVLCSAHDRVRAIGTRMEELTTRMERGEHSDALLTEYDRLSARFESLGGYNTDVMRNRVANGLGIPASMRAQPFDTLSGGERTRVNLARLILEDTDILLLDEPTNHLDMQAVEWLEDYLRRFRGTVLAVSHDRWFLDTAVTRCIEIEEGKAVLYSGNYSFYVEEKERRYQERLRRYEKEQAKAAQLRAAADRMRLWAFMGNDKQYKRAISMEKRIDRLQTTDRPKKERAMKARFSEQEFHGDEVLVAEDLALCYGDRTLFSGADLLSTGGERIALIGPNGTGKTSFLKLVLGEEEPTKGRVYLGPSVKSAYLPQHVRFDDPSASALDTVMASLRCTAQEARDRLGAFRFSGEDVFRPVGALSGGEQSRLRLCILMRDEINLLILDEPTNHLDLASREWIESALEGYGEAILFVSHDRWFIEKFATRIWELRDGRIEDFRGTFSEYREWRARQTTLTQAEKKEVRRREPKKTRAPSREKLLARAEREVEKAEAVLAELDAEMEKCATDYERLMELQPQRDAAAEALDAAYARWEELEEQES